MKKIIAFTLLLALLLVGVLGCASAKTAPQAAAAPAAPAPYPAEATRNKSMAAADMLADVEKTAETAAGWANSADIAADTGGGYGGHKIIKNASMGLETRQFDQDLNYIKQKAEEMGGYVSSSNVSGRKPENYGDSGRYANLSLRIPQARMEAFLSDARGIATVTYESTGGEDITASYFDTESRLSVYTSQRERIMKLLETADKMEDIISLETELSRLTYEIESLTTQIKRWDDLVDYATINMDLQEVAPASASASDDSMGTRINEGLQDTLAGMAVFFENLLVFLIAASPVLAILAVIGVVVLLIVRRNRKKHAGKPRGAYYDAQAKPEEKKDKEN